MCWWAGIEGGGGGKGRKKDVDFEKRVLEDFGFV